MKISFFVPGIPAPGGSKKGFVRGGKVCIVDDARRNKEWRSTVALAASEAYKGELLTGAVETAFVFYFPRPKSHYRSGKFAHVLRPDAPDLHTNKPDCLKLARSTEDVLTGVIWRDDSTTVDLYASKRYGDRPGCLVAIWTREG